MIKETIPITTRVTKSCVIKTSISLWAKRKVNRNWDNNLVRTNQRKEGQSCIKLWFISQKHVHMSKTVSIRDLSRKVSNPTRAVRDKNMKMFVRSTSSSWVSLHKKRNYCESMPYEKASRTKHKINREKRNITLN